MARRAVAIWRNALRVCSRVKGSIIIIIPMRCSLCLISRKDHKRPPEAIWRPSHRSEGGEGHSSLADMTTSSFISSMATVRFFLDDAFSFKLNLRVAEYPFFASFFFFWSVQRSIFVARAKVYTYILIYYNNWLLKFIMWLRLNILWWFCEIFTSLISPLLSSNRKLQQWWKMCHFRVWSTHEHDGFLND